MGQDSNVEQDAAADVVVLEACDMMGKHINGAHGVPKRFIKRVSPSGDTDGQTSTVRLDDGDILNVFLPAHEVRALLGWP